MIIILDTNIIQSDWKMTGSRFAVLFDYARRTRSSFVIPELVLEELVANYQRGVADAIGKASTAVQHLARFTEIVPLEAGDPDRLADTYRTYVRERLQLSDAQVVPIRDTHMREMVSRAVHRRPPCSDNKDFRDTLIWLTVLDVAVESGQPVTFISGNTAQFAIDGGLLHPALDVEARGSGLDVEYYRSLGDFTKAHATPIEFITREWLLAHVDAKALLREVIEEADLMETAHDAGRSVHGWDSGVRIVREQSASIELKRYYVNRLASGTIHVTLEWEGALEYTYTARGFADEDREFTYPIHLRAIVTSDLVIVGGDIVIPPVDSRMIAVFAS